METVIEEGPALGRMHLFNLCKVTYDFKAPSLTCGPPPYSGVIRSHGDETGLPGEARYWVIDLGLPLPCSQQSFPTS